MGCPICFEDYDEQEELRPAAFPCGEYGVHHPPSQTIAAVQDERRRCCPMCREPASLDSLLKIYISNLDLPLIAESQVEETDDAYLAATYDKKRQTELVRELKEFEELVKLYIVSVRGLSTETVSKAGKKLYTLLNAHGADRALEEGFLQDALSALHNVTANLSRQHDQLSEVHRDLTRQRRDVQRLERELKSRSKDISRREKEMDKKQAYVNELRAELKEEKSRLDETLSNANSTVRDSEDIAKRVKEEMAGLRLRTSRQVRTAEHEAEQRVTAAEARAAAAEERMEKAEQAREAALSKSATLADQLRSNLVNLNEARSRKATWKERADVEERAKMEAWKEVARLQTKLDAQAARPHSPSRAARKSLPNAAAPLFASTNKRKRLSDVSAAHPSVHIHDRCTAESTSPTSSPRNISNVGEDSLIVDASYLMDLDDDSFPMPGTRRVGGGGGGRQSAAHVSRAQWAPPKKTKRTVADAADTSGSLGTSAEDRSLAASLGVFSSKVLAKERDHFDKVQAATRVAKRARAVLDAAQQRGNNKKVDSSHEAGQFSRSRTPDNDIQPPHFNLRSPLRSPSPSRTPNVMLSPHSPLSHGRNRTSSGFEYGSPPGLAGSRMFPKDKNRQVPFRGAVGQKTPDYDRGSGQGKLGTGRSDRVPADLVARALGNGGNAALGPKRRPRG